MVDRMEQIWMKPAKPLPTLKTVSSRKLMNRNSRGANTSIAMSAQLIRWVASITLSLLAS